MEEYEPRSPATRLQAGIFAIVTQLKQGPLPGEEQSVSIMRNIHTLGTCAVRPLTLTLPAFFARKLHIPESYAVDVGIGTTTTRIHQRSPLATNYFAAMEYDGLSESHGSPRRLLYGVQFTEHYYEWRPGHSHHTNDISVTEADQLIDWLKDVPPPPRSANGPLTIFPRA